MAYITDENGNYKRTVRCGYCYEKGHNKSACPKRKTDLKASVKRYTQELAESTAPADDWERRNIERYLRHSKQELHKMETRGQNRKCGFCGEAGHTRRTCPHRKAKVAEELSKTLDLRRKIVSRMMDAGFGPGALVAIGMMEGETRPTMAIVEHVNLGEVAPSHAVSRDQYYYGMQSGIRYQYVVPRKDSWSDRYHTHGVCYMPPEYLNIDDIPQDEWYRQPQNNSCTLLSGVDISEDCLAGADALDEKKVEKWVLNNLVDPK